jgi:hypothetical protein
VRGLANQTIRRLERIETELLAERNSRVDDLGLLVDLIESAGAPSTSACAGSRSRCTQPAARPSTASAKPLALASGRLGQRAGIDGARRRPGASVSDQRRVGEQHVLRLLAEVVGGGAAAGSGRRRRRRTGSSPSSPSSRGRVNVYSEYAITVEAATTETSWSTSASE